MNLLSACRLSSFAACLSIAAPAFAQAPPAVTAADYARAEQLLSYNTEAAVLRTVEAPIWLPTGKFRYRTRTTRGVEFLLVDPARGTRKPAFDQAAVARALSTADGHEYDPGQLPFDTFELSADEQRISFGAGSRRWQCNLRQNRCRELRSLSPNEVLSPDRTKTVFIRDHNLWLRDLATGNETQLTQDGVKDFGYATDNVGWRHTDQAIVLWSPDSKRIATFQQDQRGVGEMYLVKTMPGHPQLDVWKYPMPGDTVIPTIHRVIIELGASPRVVRLRVPPDVRRSTSRSGTATGFELADAQWSANSTHLMFISTARDYRRVQLRIADAATGEVRDILEERTPTFYESSTWLDGDAVNCRYLETTNEVIWYSPRDNWHHLYLYDAATGKLQQQITSGKWNVTKLLTVDERNRVLYFMGAGREVERNPYFEHLYRVGFDGKGLTLLTPENATHEVAVAPSGEYFVDSYSTPDAPPVAVLRNRKGKLLRTLETADISRLLAAGWKSPVSITVKARDGVTDLYGLMFTPSHLDEHRKYPIVNNIYPGPQMGAVGPRKFLASRGNQGDAQSLAELGFIVVQIDGMGTPLRSKAFHDAWYGDVRDNTLPDQVAGMKQLAQRYPWIDLDRVGIYGISGGGNATARALFDYPDFFKVGVAVNGNHDQRSYIDAWGEKWMGLLERKPDGTSNYDIHANQSVAKNLAGHLLLVHSTMDDNVTLNMALVLVDELIRANKDFDLLLLPNQRHAPTGAADRYLVRRRWDYFVRHLKGAVPPKEFQIRGDAVAAKRRAGAH